MWSRTDQRQIAGEDHVEELRQFVKARLADEAADAGDSRARRARIGRRPWRRTKHRWRSETPRTRRRRAAYIASRARGTLAPDRCRRPGKRASPTARCRK